VTDVLQLVWDLGKVAEDAALRGDDRAAAVVRSAAKHIMDAQAEVCALERRREKDRKRKRTSAESVESTESAEAPKVSPDPFLTPKTDESSRVRARDNEDAELLEQCTDMLSSQMGNLWSDVDDFLRRRDYSTWLGWVKEMLTILTGGKALPVDLAQVCRDDAALDRPIGSPKGLRSFIANAILERTTPSVAVAVQPIRRAAGGVAQRTYNNGRTALDGL